MFNTGDIVKYSKPLDADEENVRFRVLESHEDAEPPRVHVEVLDSDWDIAPIEVLPPSELCAS